MAALFQERAPRLFERLGEIGVPTDLVAPTATVERNAPLCEAIPRIYSCDLAREEAIKNEETTRAWLAEHMDLLPGEPRLIDVTPEMCTEDTCYAERDGVLTFFDDNHLSATLAQGLDTYFEESVEAVLE